MKNRQMAVVAVYLLVFNSEKMETLLCLRQNTGFCDGMYSLIAGHVDPMESAFSAMVREAKEEAGMDISEENLHPVCCLHRKAKDGMRIDIFFELKNYKGKIENMEPHKCKELKFFNLDGLPSNIIDFVKKALFNSLKNTVVFEHGW